MRSTGWSGLGWLSNDNWIRESRNRRIAFHYTSAHAAAEIVAAGSIRTSRPFDNRRGPARPSGVYATFLHPFSADNDLGSVKERIFVKPAAKHVDALVIVGLSHHWTQLSEFELVLFRPMVDDAYVILGAGFWRLPD